MRKTIITIMLCVGFVSLCEAGRDPVTGKYIRYNAHSPEAKRDLEALEKALKIMRKMDCKKPSSWYFQGAIHQVPDTIANGINPFCEYLGKSQKLPAWSNCTHHPNEMDQDATIHFLVWHRIYIYYFERIVRELSDYPDFALPYWSYTEKKEYTSLPPGYTSDNSSLYVKARNQDLNGGGQLKSGGELLFKQLEKDQKNLSEIASFNLFNRRIDRSPHGDIHVHTGLSRGNEELFNDILQINGNGYMRYTQSAGFDPIFWLHHSNVDRLWTLWEKEQLEKRGRGALGDVLPNVKDLEEVAWDYLFYDENETEVRFEIKDAVNFALDSIDYVFNDLRDVKFIDDLKRERRQVISAQTGNTLTLDIQDFSKTSVDKPNKQFRVKWDVPPFPKVEGVYYWKLTIVLSAMNGSDRSYRVHVKKPGFLRSYKNKNFVGLINFFGLGEHGDSSGQDHHQKEFVFDISDEVSIKDDFEGILEFRIDQLSDDFKDEKVIVESIKLERITISN